MLAVLPYQVRAKLRATESHERTQAKYGEKIQKLGNRGTWWYSDRIAPPSTSSTNVEAPSEIL